ncbi:hypothetical protein PENSUB_11274 [Penicillium subrubescens]|uniref:Uncharacterized protein n=1 Tax=Penicillium subrubescens TaxID=1316194 RepID=A0A1Q5T4P8_9EURO|nr:hypothetical protein PENSUB_11274 [Penicillium subrubescens]
MAVDLRTDDNLHQQLLALKGPTRQTEKTSYAPYDEIMSDSIASKTDARFGQNVRFQRRDRVDGITRKEDREGRRHVYCTYFICVKPG